MGLRLQKYDCQAANKWGSFRLPCFDAVMAGGKVTSEMTADAGASMASNQDSTKAGIQTKTLMDSSTDIIIFKDGAGRWTEMNHYAKTVFRLEQVDYRGKTNVELAEYSPVLQMMLSSCVSSDEEAWRTKAPVHTHEYYTDAAGSVVMFSIKKIPEFEVDGSRRKLIVVGTNITEKIHVQDYVPASEQHFRALFEKHPDPVYAFNLDGMFTMCNRAVGKLTGYPAHEILEKSFRDIVHPAFLEAASKHFSDTCLGISQNYETVVLRKDGTVAYVDVTTFPVIENGTTVGIYGIARDRTTLKKTQEEKRQAEERVRYIAYHDELTGLPNRKAFTESLGRCIQETGARTNGLGLVFLDLDGFRGINEVFGIGIGDKVIQAVVSRLKGCLQSHGEMYSVAGDSVAFLFRESGGREQVVAHADNILRVLREPLVVEGYKLYITASIGVNTYPDGGTDAEELIRNCHIALQQAKESGKNQSAVFTPTMNLATHKRYVLQNDLRTALEQDAFTVFYQPRVNPHTNEIVGAEALLRWNHADWGIISPKDFIPIAEESGQIIHIGAWVLRTVCQQIHSWEKSGIRTVPVSVNVSVKQLALVNFATQLSELLVEFGLDGRSVELEITESAVMQDAEVAKTAIQELQAMGVKVAMDDFGTGYSSLSYLKRFKFDTLKLDKSFIHDVETEEESQAIIQTVIDLSHSLGMQVVIEGVETERQADVLKKLKCDEIQGFLYSGPVPATELKRLLRNGYLGDKLTFKSAANRREFFRVDLRYPLVSDMTIETVQGKKVTIGSTEVLIVDIGPGGMRFTSNIRLPISNNVVLKFRTTIYTDIELFGNIVWGSAFTDGIFEYGVSFNADEPQLTLLTQLLNKLLIQLRQHPVIPECRFHMDSFRRFFGSSTRERLLDD